MTNMTRTTHKSDRSQNAVTRAVKIAMAVNGEHQGDWGRSRACGRSVSDTGRGTPPPPPAPPTVWPGASSACVQQQVAALRVVQQLMRHSDPATTAGYAKLVNRAGAQLVELLPLPRAA